MDIKDIAIMNIDSKQKVVLVFSGYNLRGIVAICRFFKLNNIHFLIISESADDLINFTDYKKYVIHQRKNNELAIDDLVYYKNLIKSKFQFDEILILPSTEFLNRFLLKERKNLEGLGYVIPLVDEELYSEISDKYSFCKICDKNGIQIPKEYKTFENMSYPFVAKPVEYFTNNQKVNEKPILIFNDKDLKILRSKMESAKFFFQEFISGVSYYLLYYFDKEQKFSLYSQENLIQQHNGLSIIAAKSSDIHKKDIAIKFANIFQEMKFRGLIMVELKEYKGEFYMIEANPRLWGPSQLILDSGMDLFYKFADDYDLLKQNNFEPLEYKLDIKYFWFGGIVEDQKKELEVAFHRYKKEEFFNEYYEWVKNDIYLKMDTINLFHYEIKIN